MIGSRTHYIVTSFTHSHAHYQKKKKKMMIMMIMMKKPTSEFRGVRGWEERERELRIESQVLQARV